MQQMMLMPLVMKKTYAPASQNAKKILGTINIA